MPTKRIAVRYLINLVGFVSLPQSYKNVRGKKPLEGRAKNRPGLNRAKGRFVCGRSAARVARKS